jgi:hypothetical protein
LGSDCGIVNVNIGPSGAEIGGAFGGEKETYVSFSFFLSQLPVPIIVCHVGVGHSSVLLI